MNQQRGFDDAVRSFWSVRESQAAKQLASGKLDAGSRGSVTGGGHLDGIAKLLAQVFMEAGFAPSSIRRTRGIELPGFYRPTKSWDLVVIHNEILVAAIEFKSQAGPSFGNNFNNRTEEALGNAVDVWRAYEEGTFGSVRPWLGCYIFFLEEAKKSTTPVRLARSVFPVEQIFQGTSYKDATKFCVSAWSARGFTTQPVSSRLRPTRRFQSISRQPNSASRTSSQPLQAGRHTSKHWATCTAIYRGLLDRWGLRIFASISFCGKPANTKGPPAHRTFRDGVSRRHSVAREMLRRRPERAPFPASFLPCPAWGLNNPISHRQFDTRRHPVWRRVMSWARGS